MSKNFTNPYVIFEESLIEGMYPPMRQGYEGRAHAFMGLLGGTIALSLLYLFLTLKRTRKLGKDIWFMKVIKQSQGHYLVCNQYFVYPIGVILSCIVWIVYISQNVAWRTQKIDPRNCFYWMTMAPTIPAFFMTYTTTFAVLSGANLASSRRSIPSHHVMSPKVANGIFLLLPLFITALFVTSARAGGAFRHVFVLWEHLFEQTQRQAADYTGPGDGSDVQSVVQSLGLQEMKILTAPYRDFLEFQRVNMITNLVCFGSLLILNLTGIGLITALRMTRNARLVSRNAPLVAPLGPLATESNSNSNASSPSLINIPAGSSTVNLSRTVTHTDGRSFATTAKGKEAERDKEWYEDPHAVMGGTDGPSGDGGAKLGGQRLEWDITLFYFGVAPVVLIFISYASWILAQTELSYANANTLELFTAGIPWTYSGIAALSLSALIIKRVVDLRSRPKPAPATVVATVPEMPSGHVRTRSKAARDRDSLFVD
ncbi:hypothetical protein T439DRAFT_321402 [Meredithblackwellia eburnea MCA 4105]